MDPTGDALAPELGDPHPEFDVERIRKDFPALDQEIHGRPLVYLDNAATSQKPDRVIEAIRRFYRQDNSNVHRGVHALSQRATDAYERAREGLLDLLGAPGGATAVWVRGTTEAINLVARSHVRPNVGPDDAILLTEMEHHSNIVPWQRVRDETGAELRVVDVTDEGSLDMADLDAKLDETVAFVSLTHVSNVLGTVNPVAEITDKAHDVGARVLVDGAQAVPHLPVDVDGIGCDFYVLSGHKMYGPTGIGALVADVDLLDEMPPYQGGGEMITRVTWEASEFKEPPYRFEAGTPDIAGAVGLGAAVAYIDEVGIERIHAHEADVTDYATDRLEEVEGLRQIGTAPGKAGVLSFVFEEIHAHDVGTILDREGVAIRAGHHCTQPLMDRFDVPATARASLGMYNTRAEVDRLVAALDEVREVFG